jgi:hypothetical protein
MVDTMAAFPHTSLPPVVALLPSGVAVAAGKTGVVVVVVAATTAEPYALSPPSRIVSSSTALLMPPLLGPGDISGRWSAQRWGGKSWDAVALVEHDWDLHPWGTL